MKKIEKISEDTRNQLYFKSVGSLPDDPTQAGFRASEIKDKMTEPYIGTMKSLLTEINRIVGEINTEYDPKGLFVDLVKFSGRPITDLNDVPLMNGYILIDTDKNIANSPAYCSVVLQLVSYQPEYERYFVTQIGDSGKLLLRGLTFDAINNELLLDSSWKEYATQDFVRDQITALGNGFDLKGEVNTFADLPKGNNKIGDVWFVKDESVGYVWLSSEGVERWEQFGKPIDLSIFYTKDEANGRFVNVNTHATTEQRGTIQLANDDDIALGSDTTKAVTPKQLRDNILTIGTALNFRGNVPTFGDLPNTGNKLGDVWFVIDESVGYIWLEVEGVLKWEQFGKPIDLSGYLTIADANKKYDAIELGSVLDGSEFDIGPKLVADMFLENDKDIHLQWSNWLVTLGRHDRKVNGNKVYYSATMELEGTKYLYTLTVDKSTNKGLLERVEEDIIVDMGEHTLNNGATFNITLANASKRNVVYIKIFDKATNRTRFFKKNWIDKDNTTFTFSEMWNNIAGQIVITTADAKAVYSEVILADKNTASAMANRLKFNQLLDTAKSTLPTANGLTVTNIYGGHNVVGTTDRQYYHKMYELATISGHWYYFAPNFSNTKSVYILGHIDGTAFSTNKGKVFEGGSKFDAYIQIEKDKTMDFDVQPILVDLTEMFGSGNEPTTDTDVYLYFAKNTYYPYVDTPTKNEINANMMGLLSENVIDNVYKKPTEWGTIFTDFIAPDNGTLYVQFNTSKTNPVNSHIFVQANRSGDITFAGYGFTKNGYSNQYICTTPVTKGFRYRWLMSFSDQATITKYISKFIYAEVLK